MSQVNTGAMRRTFAVQIDKQPGFLRGRLKFMLMCLAGDSRGGRVTAQQLAKTQADLWTRSDAHWRRHLDKLQQLGYIQQLDDGSVRLLLP